MAVNPKLILLAAETLSSEEGRNRVLQIVLYALGVVLMIVVVFAGLISGLLGVIQNSNLQQHWNYVRSSITELFDGMENDINTDVKNEVYDFMPEFSINLSKATIGNKFDGNSLILYDEEEIAAAEYVMLQYATQFRSITNETDFNAFMAGYPDDTLEYTDIIKIQFTDDTGIDNIDKYEENLQRFLFMRASEQLSQYYDIYSTHFNDITIKECKFPNDLEKIFFRNNIFFLCELQKYKYNELYDWLKNNFDNILVDSRKCN